MRQKNEEQKIDFVLTWVDGNDIEWQKKKALYSGKDFDPNDVMRYRDWGLLKYWFRSVEKYAPWVNQVFFITCDQVPKWMNRDNPKLRLVNHSEYIPTKYLPTFSSRAIDMNLHLIDDLSEYFVRFDDDMFLTSPVAQEDFFHDQLPRAIGICDVNCVQGTYKDGKPIPIDKMFFTTATDIAVINRHFDKNKVILSNIRRWISPQYGMRGVKNLLLFPFRYFSSFELFHIPYPYLKSTFDRVWQLEHYVLDQACEHKFRQNTDVNHWLFYYWQLAEGCFYPQDIRIGHSFSICEAQKQAMVDAVKNQMYKMICLNDNYNEDHFEEMKLALQQAFDALLPEKSSFEK